MSDMKQIESVEVFFTKPGITIRFSDDTEQRIDIGRMIICCQPGAEQVVTAADIKAEAARLKCVRRLAVESADVAAEKKQAELARLETSEERRRIEATARAVLVDRAARDLARDDMAGMLAQLQVVAAAVVEKIGG